MIVEFFSVFVMALAFAGFAARRLLTYLHAFQQEEYDDPRFAGWLLKNRVFDRKLTAILAISGGLWFFLPDFVTNLIVLIGTAVITYSERDPRNQSKKKLAMTQRAKRIYGFALGFAGLLLLGIGALVLLASSLPWSWIIFVQSLPFLLIAANLTLAPYENAVQNRFWAEAHEKITALNPVVIGITGSFGKTSVKHILGHILNSVAPALITPGSVNTPMGVARIIREQLDETHRYVIVEMGAYGSGSIARLCRLAPPSHGILTTVGHAHYERFKSLDTVAATKMELAEAVVAKGGTMVMGEKLLRFDAGENLYSQHPGNFVICGRESKDGLHIRKIEQTEKGLEVVLSWDGTSYLLKAPLYGAHHGENIAMAYAMALKLGLAPETVEAALRTLPQIPHRLEVKKNSKGGIIIDDAYNSNPPGFTSALDLLDFIGMQNRTILITPGMVELGKLHDEVHRQIGAYAATKCNVCIAIQPARIPTFIEGFKAAGTQAELIEMQTFDEAQRWLAQNMTEKDVVLLENDLPDVYERVPRL